MSRVKKSKNAVMTLATNSKQQQTFLSYFTKLTTSTSPLVHSPHDSANSHVNEDYPCGLEKSDDGTRKKLKRSESVNRQTEVDCSPTLFSPDTEVRRRLIAKAEELPIIDQTMGLTWFEALEKEFDKDYFKKLNDFVQNARNVGTVYPPATRVWEWTRHTSIHDVKVVILGQDPYHGPDQAHGLCFSVLNVAAPPSLVNMYNELGTDVGKNFTKPNHGCLVGWAAQGVLLMNAVLTVNAHQANSHKGRGWEELTDATISWISKNLNSVVFLLWGAYAQKKASMVDKKKHHLLQTVHPSPLSCHRGFFGCKHFSKCNELLEKNGKKPIDWNHLPKV